MPSSPVLNIITGASRGLGAAVAEQLLEPGATLICIARGTHPTIEERGRQSGATVLQWSCDLSEPRAAAERLRDWLAAEPADRFGGANLINNAGVISRIGPVDACPLDELSRAVRVGLEAPLLLSAAFLGATRRWQASRRVLNISSGLGRHAIAGAASYCAAKAGLDNLSRALALDEAGQANGARIVSLAPGVIDTDMQQQLRDASPTASRNTALSSASRSRGDSTRPPPLHARWSSSFGRPDFGEEVLADVRGS